MDKQLTPQEVQDQLLKSRDFQETISDIVLPEWRNDANEIQEMKMTETLTLAHLILRKGLLQPFFHRYFLHKTWEEMETEGFKSPKLRCYEAVAQIREYRKKHLKEEIMAAKRFNDGYHYSLEPVVGSFLWKLVVTQTKSGKISGQWRSPADNRSGLVNLIGLVAWKLYDNGGTFDPAWIMCPKEESSEAKAS